MLVEDDSPHKMAITEVQSLILILDLIWEVLHKIVFMLNERYDIYRSKLWIFTNGWRTLFYLGRDQISLLSREDLLHEFQSTIFWFWKNDIDSDCEVIVEIPFRDQFLVDFLERRHFLIIIIVNLLRFN